jgi:regulator of protease activity HflC (stomatin/prohibitin superfamily)
MRAYVYDTIRASLCHMTLDHAFESKDEISMALKSHLQEIMGLYGISILNALITDLTPDARVRDGKKQYFHSTEICYSYRYFCQYLCSYE